ncbi:MAG: acyl carrier protein [Pseudomonadota bacterium]
MDKAREILAEALNLPVEQVSDDAAIGAQDGWDSLSHIRLIAAMEKTLERELTTEEAISINSLASIDAVLSGAQAG